MTAMIQLGITVEQQAICLDTDCSFGPIEKDFLLSQAPDTKSRQCAMPVAVRGIGLSPVARSAG